MLATKASDDDTEERILKQVEFYFSSQNLVTDKFLIAHIEKDKDGWVPIALLLTFPRIKKLTQDVNAVARALRRSKEMLEVKEDGSAVRRVTQVKVEPYYSSRTVEVRGFPESLASPVDDIIGHFMFLNPSKVSLYNYKLGRYELFSGCATVEFPRTALAEAALNLTTYENPLGERCILKIKLLKDILDEENELQRRRKQRSSNELHGDSKRSSRKDNEREARESSSAHRKEEKARSSKRESKDESKKSSTHEETNTPNPEEFTQNDSKASRSEELSKKVQVKSAENKGKASSSSKPYSGRERERKEIEDEDGRLYNRRVLYTLHYLPGGKMHDLDTPMCKSSRSLDSSVVEGGLILAEGFPISALERDIESFFDRYGPLKWIEHDRQSGVALVLFKHQGIGVALAKVWGLATIREEVRVNEAIVWTKYRGLQIDVSEPSDVQSVSFYAEFQERLSAMPASTAGGGKAKMREAGRSRHERNYDFHHSPAEGCLICAEGFRSSTHNRDIEKFFHYYGTVQCIRHDEENGVRFVLFKKSGRGSELARGWGPAGRGKTFRVNGRSVKTKYQGVTVWVREPTTDESVNFNAWFEKGVKSMPGKSSESGNASGVKSDGSKEAATEDRAEQLASYKKRKADPMEDQPEEKRKKMAEDADVPSDFIHAPASCTKRKAHDAEDQPDEKPLKLVNDATVVSAKKINDEDATEQSKEKLTNLDNKFEVVLKAVVRGENSNFEELEEQLKKKPSSSAFGEDGENAHEAALNGNKRKAEDAQNQSEEKRQRMAELLETGLEVRVGAGFKRKAEDQEEQPEEKRLKLAQDQKGTVHVEGVMTAEDPQGGNGKPGNV
ncbi:hypothetical protein M427DRAFT_146924 [Gonapodya prolifera JEL478]|uniref:HTH La-type RNA-binding domain-containing protein n=1 Tax=Gonapodya prolifera (strain JEL478) TaxID=1344416 RepID=A0A139A8U7_GONPJ|nr:hypothetical protein M427DRAFT_146924 [Gonapodya prolifera JEL478]|eukprot:KXS12885.1 hypothetical protein M427DRAFT_146924 [Gonapodya prolifera JEL478]